MLTENKKLILLGRNIKTARKLKDLSQLELAKRLNISREHLANIETAKRRISLKLLFNLCECLSISESELFKYH